jgi:basic amino acid/polyamine antiporter, APA family
VAALSHEEHRELSSRQPANTTTTQDLKAEIS